MTITETIKTAAPLASAAATNMIRWGRFAWDLLSFSPADDRIAPGRCLALALENGGISVSYGSRIWSRMKIGATRFYPFETGKYPLPENLASAALLALNDYKAAGAQVTLVIPKDWVILKTAEFPLAAKDDLANVISYELDRLTPISSDKALFDFRILAEDGNRIETLLAATRADRLTSYLEALRERGIAVTRVAVSLFALGTLDHYLQGGAERRALLRDGIGVPVQSLGEIDPKHPVLETAEALPRTAMGGVLETLWPHAGGMNLLARGIHSSPRPPKAPTVVLVAMLIVSCLIWLISPLQLQEKKIEALDREIAARGSEVKRIETLKRELEGVAGEIAAINNFKSSHPLVINLLKEMTEVLPGNVWLTRARIAESTIELEGYAASATDVVPKLEASQYFKKVEFSSPTFRDLRLNADRFLIKMEIEGLPDEKAKK